MKCWKFFAWHPKSNCSAEFVGTWMVTRPASLTWYIERSKEILWPKSYTVLTGDCMLPVKPLFDWKRKSLSLLDLAVSVL
jgi:hypothetical protein